MNMQFRPGAQPDASSSVKTAIADCDIHPARKGGLKDLYPWMAKRWHEHLEVYGKHPYQGMMEGPPYPKAQPNASRRDAYPPEGGQQGSSLSFMQQQHLDPNNVALGVLCPLQTGQGIRNQDLSAAFGDRRQRVADRGMDQQGQPPQGLHRRRERGRSGGGSGDSKTGPATRTLSRCCC